MKRYPKHINCKQDFINLLSMPEHKERASNELKRIQSLDDSKVVRVVSGTEEEGNLITETIDNPMPQWKRVGFASAKELSSLAAMEVK